MGCMGLVESDFAWITERIQEVARRHAQGRIVPAWRGYNLDAGAQRGSAPAGAGGGVMVIDDFEGWLRAFTPANGAG